MASTDRDRSEVYPGTSAGPRRPGTAAAYSTRSTFMGTGPRFGPPPAPPGASRMHNPGVQGPATGASPNTRPGGYAELAQMRRGVGPGLSTQPRSKTPAVSRPATVPQTPSSRRALTPPSRMAGQLAQRSAATSAGLRAGPSQPAAAGLGAGWGPSRRPGTTTPAFAPAPTLATPAASPSGYPSPVRTPITVTHATTPTAQQQAVPSASGLPAGAAHGGGQGQDYGHFHDDDDVVAMYGSSHGSVMARSPAGLEQPGATMGGTDSLRFQDPGDDWTTSYERSTNDLLQRLEGILGGLNRINGLDGAAVEARAPPLPLPVTSKQAPAVPGSPRSGWAPVPPTPGLSFHPMPRPGGAAAQSPGGHQAQSGPAPSGAGVGSAAAAAASPSLGVSLTGNGPTPAAASVPAATTALLATWPRVAPPVLHPAAHQTNDGSSQGQGQGQSRAAAAVVQTPQLVPTAAAAVAAPLASREDGRPAPTPDAASGPVRHEAAAVATIAAITTADGAAAPSVSPATAAPSVSPATAGPGAVLPPGALQELWHVLQASNQNTARLMADLAATRREVELANERAEEADSLARVYQQQLVLRQQRVASWQAALAEMEGREAAAKQQLSEVQERCSELAQRAEQAERVAAVVQLRLERLAAQRAVQLQSGREGSVLSDGGLEEQRSRDEVKQLHTQLGRLRADLAAAQTRATRAELELAIARNKALIAQQELAAEEDRARRAAATAATAREELGRNRYALELLGRDHDRLHHHLRGLRIQRHFLDGEQHHQHPNPHDQHQQQRQQKLSSGESTSDSLHSQASARPRPSATSHPLDSARSEWRTSPSPERPPAIASSRSRSTSPTQPYEARRGAPPVYDTHEDERAVARVPDHFTAGGTASRDVPSTAGGDAPAVMRSRAAAVDAPYGSSKTANDRTVAKTSDGSSASTSSGGSLAAALGAGRRRPADAAYGDATAAAPIVTVTPGLQRTCSGAPDRQRHGSLLLLAPGEVPPDSSSSSRYGQRQSTTPAPLQRIGSRGSPPDLGAPGVPSAGDGGGAGGGGSSGGQGAARSGGQSPVASGGAMARGVARGAAHGGPGGRGPGSRARSRLGAAAAQGGLPSAGADSLGEPGSDAGKDAFRSTGGPNDDSDDDGDAYGGDGSHAADADIGGEAGWPGSPVVTLAALRAGYASASGSYRGVPSGNPMHEMLPLTRVPSSGARRWGPSTGTSQGSSSCRSTPPPPSPPAASSPRPAVGSADLPPATGEGRTPVWHESDAARAMTIPQQPTLQQQPLQQYHLHQSPSAGSLATQIAAGTPVAAAATASSAHSTPPPQPQTGPRQGEMRVSLAELRRQMAAGDGRVGAAAQEPLSGTDQRQPASGSAAKQPAAAGPLLSPLLVPEHLPPLEQSYSPTDRGRAGAGGAGMSPLGAMAVTAKPSEEVPIPVPASIQPASPAAAATPRAGTAGSTASFGLSTCAGAAEAAQTPAAVLTRASLDVRSPGAGVPAAGLPKDTSLPQGYRTSHMNDLYESRGDRWTQAAQAQVGPKYVRRGALPSSQGAQLDLRDGRQPPHSGNSNARHQAEGPLLQLTPRSRMLSPSQLDSHLVHASFTASMAVAAGQEGAVPAGLSGSRRSSPLRRANALEPPTPGGTPYNGHAGHAAHHQQHPSRHQQQRQQPQQLQRQQQPSGSTVAGAQAGAAAGVGARPERPWWQRLLRRRQPSQGRPRSPARRADAAVSERGSGGTELGSSRTLCRVGSPRVTSGSLAPCGGTARRRESSRSGDEGGGEGLRALRSALLHLGMWSGGVALGVLLVLGLAGVVEGALGVGAAAEGQYPPGLVGFGCGCPPLGRGGGGGPCGDAGAGSRCTTSKGLKEASLSRLSE